MNKFTIKGKVKIILNNNTKQVLKPYTKDLTSLFDYLDIRDFPYHPKILDYDNNYIRYEYIDNISTTPSLLDLIDKASLLHYKTSYYKEVSTKKHKEIYNKLIDKLDYIKDKYLTKIETIDNERFMSPSSYLFARNYSLIESNLNYIEKELNEWYNLVKDTPKERISIVHNNLQRNNLIDKDNPILTGWDNYLVDTPILDLYKLYKNEYNNIDILYSFIKYNETYKLTNPELKLFFILISFPLKIKEEEFNYTNVKNIKESLLYTYKTSNFIKSYHKEVDKIKE